MARTSSLTWARSRLSENPVAPSIDDEQHEHGEQDSQERQRSQGELAYGGGHQRPAPSLDPDREIDYSLRDTGQLVTRGQQVELVDAREEQCRDIRADLDE